MRNSDGNFCLIGIRWVWPNVVARDAPEFTLMGTRIAENTFVQLRLFLRLNR